MKKASRAVVGQRVMWRVTRCSRDWGRCWWEPAWGFGMASGGAGVSTCGRGQAFLRSWNPSSQGRVMGGRPVPKTAVVQPMSCAVWNDWPTQARNLRPLPDAGCWGAASSLPEEPAASLSGTPSSPPEVLSVDLAQRMGEHVQLCPLCLSLTQASLGPVPWALPVPPGMQAALDFDLGLQRPEGVPPNTACPDLWQHPNCSWGGGCRAYPGFGGTLWSWCMARPVTGSDSAQTAINLG